MGPPSRATSRESSDNANKLTCTSIQVIAFLFVEVDDDEWLLVSHTVLLGPKLSSRRCDRFEKYHFGSYNIMCDYVARLVAL
jgi:hypothetical protein